jgi:predicted nuclease of predicted toxin-antitoxin system
MRFLFDQNLSPRLVSLLSDLFPGSMHVRQAGLQAADDEVVWAYAVEHGFAIVSKDSDFRQRNFLFGHPPKVVWIRRGNCSTSEIEIILRGEYNGLLAFDQEGAGAFLALG